MTKTAQLRNEAQLIASIIGGEAHLFHELIPPYERNVYVMALSFLKNEGRCRGCSAGGFPEGISESSQFSK